MSQEPENPAVKALRTMLAGAEVQAEENRDPAVAARAAVRAASYRDALARLEEPEVQDSPEPLGFLFMDEGHKPHSVATKDEAMGLLIGADFYGAVWEWDAEVGEWVREG